MQVNRHHFRVKQNPIRPRLPAALGNIIYLTSNWLIGLSFYHHHVARIIYHVWFYGSQLKTTLIHLRHSLKIFIKTLKMKMFVTNYNFQRNYNCGHPPNTHDSLIQFVS